jgi:hypothetical protein
LSPPQVRQVEVSRAQPSPAVVQVLLAQHGWPVSPHTAHVWLVRSHPSVAEQTLSPQQPWPSSPQAQTPLVQALEPGHADTQASLRESQQPLEQAWPGQHAWPEPPHCTQTLPSQARPEAVQVSFAQHGCPAPPHDAHCVPTQVTPAAVQV